MDEKIEFREMKIDPEWRRMIEDKGIFDGKVFQAEVGGELPGILVVLIGYRVADGIRRLEVSASVRRVGQRHAFRRPAYGSGELDAIKSLLPAGAVMEEFRPSPSNPYSRFLRQTN